MERIFCACHLKIAPLISMENTIDYTIISESHRKVIHRLLDYFERHRIEYQFTGGLAGNLFGSLWKLQDIDIEVHLENLYTIEKAFKPFIVNTVHRYSDDEFEIWLLQLNIENIDIDINAVEDFIIKPNIEIETYIENAVNIQFENRVVKVQPLQDIIAYKKLLGRDKDLQELTQLTE